MSLLGFLGLLCNKSSDSKKWFWSFSLWLFWNQNKWFPTSQAYLVGLLFLYFLFRSSSLNIFFNSQYDFKTAVKYYFNLDIHFFSCQPTINTAILTTYSRGLNHILWFYLESHMHFWTRINFLLPLVVIEIWWKARRKWTLDSIIDLFKIYFVLWFFVFTWFFRSKVAKKKILIFPVNRVNEWMC